MLFKRDEKDPMATRFTASCAVVVPSSTENKASLG